MADSMELEMGVRVNGADDDTTSHMVSAPLASKKVVCYNSSTQIFSCTDNVPFLFKEDI